MEYSDKLKTILSEILELSIDKINEETSRKKYVNWDSLRHIMIISRVENEFDVDIEPEEIEELTSFGLILEFLKNAKPQSS